VKPWEWDPTKWLIWTLSKLGLTNDLRRVSQEAIHAKEARTRDLQETKAMDAPDREEGKLARV
jgi:stearoyl-CoA desaturase (delta-9 desaturase)